MHPGAFEFVSRYATSEPVSVVEVGSRDINGSIKSHFPAAVYTGIDLYPGPSVDVVCDALGYAPAEPVDLVLICEVIEHCRYWTALLNRAYLWLKPGGKIIVTCAGPGRDPHSAIDGGDLRSDEYYANVTQDSLAEELHYAGFKEIDVGGNEYWHDTYGIATKAYS